MLERLENNLKKILEKFPQTRTAAIAQLALADFYSKNKKYEQAIEIYKNIKTQTKDAELIKLLDAKIKALKAQK